MRFRVYAFELMLIRRLSHWLCKPKHPLVCKCVSVQMFSGQQSSASTSAEGGCGTATLIGYAVSISSLASFDRAAYILASLIPHFRRLAHGTVSESAILRTDARLAAACLVRARQ